MVSPGAGGLFIGGSGGGPKAPVGFPGLLFGGGPSPAVLVPGLLPSGGGPKPPIGFSSDGATSMCMAVCQGARFGPGARATSCSSGGTLPLQSCVHLQFCGALLALQTKFALRSATQPTQPLRPPGLFGSSHLQDSNPVFSVY